MQDPVDRRTLLNIIKTCKKYDVDITDDYKVDIEELEMLINTMPSIIKCENCKYVFYDEEFDAHWCTRTSGVYKVKNDDYCSFAKIKL